MSLNKRVNKLILGIETSCDDTSICLLEKQESGFPTIHFHERFSQEEMLATWGGIVPEIAARNHLDKIVPLLKSAFQQTKYKPKDIDLIAVTTLPGLLGPLLTGINVAKTLSFIFQTPIIGVNHLYAHLEAIHLTEQITYPYLGLLVSGGHTIFFLVEGRNQFKVIGRTIDDAAGEAFDKGGRLMGLPYPAGKFIDELASKTSKRSFDFPIGLKHSKDTKLSFSGLKNAIRLQMEKRPDLLKLIKDKDYSEECFDLIGSYQDAIVDALVLKLKYALALCHDKNIPIVVGGGVACNSALRNKIQKLYPKNSFFVKPEFCTDNGAMIANFGMINNDQASSYPECLHLDAQSRFINKTLERDKK